jgi:hypothetical protein
LLTYRLIISIFIGALENLIFSMVQYVIGINGMPEERDWFDKGFDKTTKFFVQLIGKGFAERWFQWVGWVMLTAALWAAGQKSGSFLVKVIAIFCAVIVFFKAWVSMERIADEVLPSPRRLPKVLVWLISFAVALIPFFAIHFISEVIQAVLK